MTEQAYPAMARGADWAKPGCTLGQLGYGRKSPRVVAPRAQLDSRTDKPSLGRPAAWKVY